MKPEMPEMSPARTDGIRGILAEQVRTAPEVRRHLLRRRVVLWGGVGIFAAGAFATGALALLNPAPVTDTSVVTCLSSTERGADGSYPGSAATISDGSGQGRVDDAIALCTEMWEQGVLSDDLDPTSAPADEPRPVPPLTVCVMSDGTAAVVPGDREGICAALGMAPLEG